MTGQILFDAFGTSFKVINDVGTPILVMCGGLLFFALFVKMRNGNGNK